MAGDDPGVSVEATCHEGAVPPLSLLGTQLGRARQETAQRTTLEARNAKQLRWQQHARPRRASPRRPRVASDVNQYPYLVNSFDTRRSRAASSCDDAEPKHSSRRFLSPSSV
jgi:hypothetical protein